MAFPWAVVGGMAGRMNEIYKEREALKLAKTEAEADDSGYYDYKELTTMFIDNPQKAKTYIPALLESNRVNPQDLPLILAAMSVADENNITFGQGPNAVTFNGYSGDAKDGTLGYASGSLDALHKYLTTKENREKFAAVYKSDQGVANTIDQFIKKNALAYKFGFQKTYSGDDQDDFGAVSPYLSSIYGNFTLPEIKDIFEPALNEYAGETDILPGQVGEISDAGDAFVVYTVGDLSQGKYNKGLTATNHYDKYKIKFKDILPDKTNQEVITALIQLASKQGKAGDIPSFLRTLNPDKALLAAGDVKGAMNHVAVAISLNNTAISKFDPQSGDPNVTTPETSQIMDILFRKANDPNGFSFNTDTAVKAVALHMKSNHYADPRLDAKPMSVEKYLESLSGLKIADIKKGKTASEKALSQLDDLENLIKKTEVVGGAQTFTTAIKGIFGETGQLSQLANQLGFDANAEGSTYQDTLKYYQKQIEDAGGINENLGAQKAIQISLAFALARAEDPSGRLSNQDVEAQLFRIGSGTFSSIDTALGAIAQTRKDIQSLDDYYGIFTRISGKQFITADQQRGIDAAFVVRKLEKDYLQNKGKERVAQSRGKMFTKKDTTSSTTTPPLQQDLIDNFKNNNIGLLLVPQAPTTKNIQQDVMYQDPNDSDMFVVQTQNGQTFSLPKGNFNNPDPNNTNIFNIQ